MNEALAFAGPAADFVGAFASLGFGLSEKDRVAREKKRVDNEVKVAKEIAAISKELVKNATTNSELKYASAFEYMIDHIISHLVKAPVDILQTFVSYSADLDKLRSQKLQDACPELWEQIKDQVEYKGKL